MKETLFRLLKYINTRRKGLLIGLMICVVLAAITSVTSYWFLSALVDDFITPLISMEDKTPGFQRLALALLGLTAVFLLGAIVTLIQGFAAARLSHDIMYSLRNELFTKMERLPLRYFDTHTRGEVMSVYTNDIDALRLMLSQGLPYLFSAIVTAVAMILALFSLNVPLSLLGLALLIGVTALSMKVIMSARGHYTAQQERLGILNGYVEEIMSGQKVVRVFHREEVCKEEFQERNASLRKSSCQAVKYTGLISALNMQAGNLIFYLPFAVLCAVCVINGWGGMTIGKTIAFLSLAKTMNVPVVLASGQLYSCVTALAGAKRIFAMTDEKPEDDQGIISLNGRRPEGSIELRHVDFSYVPGTPVLHDVTLTAKPGQKIAIVGSTGSGKTTITNLLNRFYEIEHGEILIDGISVQQYKKDELRKMIGLVMQDTHMFTGTVLDNIRYGNPSLSNEECKRAAENARAADFIERLPEGYQTVLTHDADTLAEGQRQLLNIARAVASDAPILILDEATSSVDPRTERLIQEGMDHLMEGRTSFVIAHRLSTIKNSDCILVLDHGRILESGNHEELMDKKGAYYRLYTST